MQLSRIWNLKSLFVGSKEEPTKRKERLISSFIRTHAFSKLTVQNKILSLGKLITIFRSDSRSLRARRGSSPRRAFIGKFCDRRNAETAVGHGDFDHRRYLLQGFARSRTSLYRSVSIRFSKHRAQNLSRLERA